MRGVKLVSKRIYILDKKNFIIGGVEIMKVEIMVVSNIWIFRILYILWMNFYWSLFLLVEMLGYRVGVDL